MGIARAVWIHACSFWMSRLRLDVSVRATILNLLLKLRQELNLSYLFISHDLSVLRYICDRIGILYLGRIVELAPTEDIFEAPQHPYTISLLSAAPRAEVNQSSQEIILEGEISQRAIGKGCRFSPRCPAAQIDLCREIEPPLDEVWLGHRAACHLSLQVCLGIMTASGKPVERQHTTRQGDGRITHCHRHWRHVYGYGVSG
jgi:oligopeptide/dipeptide ABC transporter ATP-binding protein